MKVIDSIPWVRCASGNVLFIGYHPFTFFVYHQFVLVLINHIQWIWLISTFFVIFVYQIWPIHFLEYHQLIVLVVLFSRYHPLTLLNIITVVFSEIIFFTSKWEGKGCFWQASSLLSVLLVVSFIRYCPLTLLDIVHQFCFCLSDIGH